MATLAEYKVYAHYASAYALACMKSSVQSEFPLVGDSTTTLESDARCAAACAIGALHGREARGIFPILAVLDAVEKLIPSPVKPEKTTPFG